VRVPSRRNGGIQAGAKAIEEHLIEMEEIDVHLPVAPQEQDISEITGADTETIVPREKLTLENEVGTSTPLRQPSCHLLRCKCYCHFYGKHFQVCMLGQIQVEMINYMRHNHNHMLCQANYDRPTSSAL
jgi:hypothetical protein